jgi:hypothetical protein
MATLFARIPLTPPFPDSSSFPHAVQAFMHIILLLAPLQIKDILHPNISMLQMHVCDCFLAKKKYEEFGAGDL